MRQSLIALPAALNRGVERHGGHLTFSRHGRSVDSGRPRCSSSAPSNTRTRRGRGHVEPVLGESILRRPALPSESVPAYVAGTMLIGTGLSPRRSLISAGRSAASAVVSQTQDAGWVRDAFPAPPHPHDTSRWQWEDRGASRGALCAVLNAIVMAPGSGRACGRARRSPPAMRPGGCWPAGAGAAGAHPRPRGRAAWSVEGVSGPRHPGCRVVRLPPPLGHSKPRGVRDAWGRPGI